MQERQFRVHDDFEETHWWFTARRRILVRLIRRIVPPGAGRVVVDMGCGTGGNLAALAGEYAAVGIDASDEALAGARRRSPAARFLRADGPDAVPDAEFVRADLVLLADVLEHVADDRAFLASILARLAPGAHVLVTVPADPGLWSAHDASFGHHRRYDAARLAEAWRGAPVSVRLFSHYNARLYAAVKLVRGLARAGGRAAGEGGTDFGRLPRPLNVLLRRIFAGEGAALERNIDRMPPGAPYPRGVSLIALLRKEGPETR